MLYPSAIEKTHHDLQTKQPPGFINSTSCLMLLDMTMDMLAIKVFSHLHDFALGVKSHHIHNRVAQRLA